MRSDTAPLAATHCGRILPAQAIFCPYCGQAVAPVAAHQERSPARKEQGIVWFRATDPPALAAFFAATDVFDDAVVAASKAYKQRRHISVFLDNDGTYRLEYELVTYNVVLPNGVLLAVPPLAFEMTGLPQHRADALLRRACVAARLQMQEILRQRYHALCG